jgi:hypothetical protein
MGLGGRGYGYMQLLLPAYAAVVSLSLFFLVTISLIIYQMFYLISRPFYYYYMIITAIAVVIQWGVILRVLSTQP